MRTARGTQVPMTPQGAPDINGIMAGWQDRGAWQYWDTLKLAAGATVVTTPYNFFANGLNQGDPYNGGATKTKLETNLPAPGGQFPSTRDMVVKQFGFYFRSGDSLADMQAIMANSYFEFKVDNKIFMEGLIQWQPAGAGITGYSLISGQQAWNNGIPDPHCTRRLGDYAKYLAPLMPFSVQLFFPETLPTLLTTAEGGEGVWLIAVMDGLTDRSVQ